MQKWEVGRVVSLMDDEEVFRKMVSDGKVCREKSTGAGWGKLLSVCIGFFL